ncbi:MAG: hypothetical protein JSS27_02080 [Planctomycetes bacterium]|nr:hypothetical protein [Planctomycetota bacterium]
MSYQFPPDLEKLVQDRMAAGGYASEDEVLRDALRALGAFDHSAAEMDDEYRNTVAAVQEGAVDADNGRVRPLRVLIEEHRNQS